MKYLALLFIAATAASASAQTVAITNAKVYPISGPPIEHATVVISNGKIAAVGTNVAVPAGARVIDATGKIVTPGFLDSSTGLGAVEIESDEGANDLATNDPQVTAAFDVSDELNPLSTLIPVTRVEGITRVIVAPHNGRSLIAGQGALVELGQVSVLRPHVAMFAALGSRGAELSGGGARAAAMLRLREALDDAKDYAAHKAAFESAQRRQYALSRLDLEALVPVVRGEVPLVISVNRASDILAALRLGKDYNLKLILSGVAEGPLVARQIADAGVTVVFDPMQDIPRMESLAISLENAAKMNAAGVNLVFASFDAHNSRNIKQMAGNAISYGLPYDVALRAVTSNPAKLWGISSSYGTLEPGKDADVVIWSADPFELTTNADVVFIRGQEMSKDTRQEELFRRYRTLDANNPPAYIK